MKTLIEDIDTRYIGNATLFHRFTTQGRYINSRDVKTTLLQGQGMATATLAATTDDTEFFAHIDGIGPEKSAAVVGWFHDAANNASAARLLDLLDVEEEKTEAAGTRCDKLTFVITGDVHHYKNRNELKAYIESQGGKGDGERQQVDQLPDQQRHGFDVFKKQKGTRTEHPHHQRGGFHSAIRGISNGKIALLLLSPLLNHATTLPKPCQPCRQAKRMAAGLFLSQRNPTISRTMTFGESGSSGIRICSQRRPNLGADATESDPRRD